MDSIYREQLMEHYKNPRNRGSMKDFTHEIEEKNPMCGDEITMQIKLKDEHIEDIRFDGDACAVSIAAASLLTEELKGKDLKDAKGVEKDDLLDLLGVDLTTSRIQCATLPLKAVKELIEKYESQS